LPGLVIYRFDGPILFFNVDYFKERVRAALAAAEPQPRWFLLDAESSLVLDTTGADVLEELRVELAAQGTTLAIARAKSWFRLMLNRSGLEDRLGRAHLFPSVRAGAEAFLAGSGDPL
jgi:sulfate permease, SulP family